MRFLVNLLASFILAAAAHAQQLAVESNLITSLDSSGYPALGHSPFSSLGDSFSSSAGRDTLAIDLAGSRTAYSIPAYGDDTGNLRASVDLSTQSYDEGIRKLEDEKQRYEADVNTVTFLFTGRPTAIPEAPGYAAILGGVAAAGSFAIRRRHGGR